MTAPPDGTWLTRSVDSIHVGARHRQDLGELSEMADSIQSRGLLQPLSVTPEGVLVCGARRLAAVKALGWKTVSVWVRTGLSDQLSRLLAEHEDNLLHKPYTPTEAAALFEELSKLISEDAAARQADTRFSTDHQPRDGGPYGAGNFPAPSSEKGETRQQAAAMIPGGLSYRTHEKVNYLRAVVGDTQHDPDVRELAAAALGRINNGAPVEPAYRQIREQVANSQAAQAELAQLAQQARQRTNSNTTLHAQPQSASMPARPQPKPAQHTARAFLAIWNELINWWLHYDATEIARQLSPEQIRIFTATAEGTVAFAQQLQQANRTQTAAAPPAGALTEPSELP